MIKNSEIVVSYNYNVSLEDLERHAEEVTKVIQKILFSANFDVNIIYSKEIIKDLVV